MALPVEIEAEVFEPRPYVANYTDKTICVVDTETDPFAPGRVPKPFSVGFWDSETYVDFWGDECVPEFFQYLAGRTDQGHQLLIYAHNGGNFDFHFFLDYLSPNQKPLLIGGRITQAWFGGQEFRDSYKILPAPLSAYKKDEVDYAKFERDVREQHRTEILAYQKTDCIYTLELIKKFHHTFGNKLTIGQAAIDVLTSITGYAKLSQHQDKVYRNWFFGGRTQAFETGVLLPNPGKRFKIVDVNSMYPFAMESCEHPIGNEMEVNTTIGPDTVFAKIELSVNDGALPRKLEDGSLDFTGGPGIYFATIHELRVAEDLGLIKIKRVLTSVHMPMRATFKEFVDRFFKLKVEAEENGDDAMRLIYKLLLNNAYGKFAQDSKRYKEFWLGDYTALPPGYIDYFDENGVLCPGDRFDAETNPGGWHIQSSPFGNNLWARANRAAWRGYRNVRIAASITGAARSLLLRGLSQAERPIYCDTDSIICEGFSGDLHPSRLGAWDLEAEGDRLAIAGKKLYALFDREELQDGRTQWRPLKKASKGVRLSAEQIVSVAKGARITDANQVPTFRMGEESTFVTRTIGKSEREIVRFGQRKRVRW